MGSHFPQSRYIELVALMEQFLERGMISLTSPSVRILNGSSCSFSTEKLNPQSTEKWQFYEHFSIFLSKTFQTLLANI